MVTQTRPKKKENLKWKISYLAAQIGQEPALTRAKYAARAQKAEDDANDDDETKLSSLNTLKAEKVERKLFHEVKEVRKIFKKAKGFETQRLVKRIKNARKGNEEDDTADGQVSAKRIPKKSSPEDVKRFEHELEVIKELNLDHLAEYSVRAKIAKNGALKSHPAVQPYLERTAKGSGTTAGGDGGEEAQVMRTIEARLLNSKVVREEFARLVQELEAIVLGGAVKKEGEEEASGKEVARKRKYKDEDEKDGDGGSEKINNANELKKSTITHTGKPGSDDAESDEGERPEPDALFDNGVEDSDGASDPHNDGYDSDGEPIATKPKAKPIKANPSAAQLIKAKEKEKQERRKAWKEKEKARKAKEKAKEKAKKTGKGPTSMFVDTLYSGSESESEPDWDDPNFDKIYNGTGKDKKNRKGQRARREEWEKKYGPEAKHLKLAPSKRGFGAHDGKSKYGRRSDRDPAPTLVAPTGANDMPLGARTGGNGAAGALHPSWEAKRRQQQALAAVGFQGKKIVFGEEGEKREVEVKAKGGKGANGTNGAWGKGNEEKEELHPSWEAKRLQTEIMSAALSGRGGGGMNKIVFNDSD